MHSGQMTCSEGLAVTLWSDVKHKQKSNPPTVSSDQKICKGYPSPAEGAKIVAADVIKRMRQVLAVTSDSALAAALDLAPSAPSNWRQRNRAPYNMCVRIARIHGVSLDWLVFGSGEMRMSGVGQVHDTSSAAYRVVSDGATRITRFLAVWDATRAPGEITWLEQHLRRTVPEYGRWFDEQPGNPPWNGI